jgi:mono/diheme cytochrome c family protein
MRPLKIAIVASLTLTIAACSVFKKNKTTPTPPSTTVGTTSSIPDPAPPKKSKNGVIAPSNEELTAIQATYKEVTMQTLTNGYAIYTGVCTNCHDAMNIHSRTTEQWQNIIDDMAPKAKLTDTQKDAVYKYVLAIKATKHNQ